MVLQKSLVLLLFTVATHCKHLTLEHIFNATNDAILSNNASQQEHVLRKYFFTKHRDDTVWWWSKQESLSMFHLEVCLNDLVPKEKSIKRMESHYETCVLEPFNTARAKCFHHMVSLLKHEKNSFLWDLNAKVSKEGRAKLGNFFLSFTAMSALLSATSLLNMEYLKYNDPVETVKEKRKWNAEYGDLIRKLNDFLFFYEEAVTSWRTDQVLSVVICESTSLLWREYSKNCESRWKRSIDDDSDNIQEPDGNNDDPSLDIADRIGGPINFYTKFYSATVIDNISKDTLFDVKFQIKEHEVKGSKILKIQKQGMKKRHEREEEVLSELASYHKRTIGVTRSIVASFSKLIIQCN